MTDGPYVAALGLRISVVVVGLAGLFALPASGLVAPGITTLAALLFVGAACASVQFSDPAGLAWRKTLSIVALVAIGLYAGVVAAPGMAEQGPAGLGPLLGLLLAGLHVAHALVLNTRRDLLVGTTVGVFMLVLASGLSPGPAVAGPLLIGWPAAVTSLVLAHRLQEQLACEVGMIPVERRGGERKRLDQTLRLRTVTTVAVSLLVGAIVFLLLPQPEGLSTRSRLLGEPVAAADTPQSASRTADFYSGGPMDLNARGALGNDPVLDVPAGLSELWRSGVLDQYDGSVWTTTAGTPSLGPLVDGVALPSPPDLGLPVGPPAIAEVHAYPAFNGVVVAPGRVARVTADGAVYQMDESVFALQQRPLGTVAYTVTTVLPERSAQALIANQGRDQATPRWLQLPDSLPQRVRDLAKTLTAKAANREAAVRAVENYLRANEKYDLASPVAPTGSDAVDDFLFNSHSGFCEHFASAETVLLRAAGIPSRVATGFAYGELQDGRLLMKASNAHAWVEVWYPGSGWSPSDPTSGTELTKTGVSKLSAILAWLSSALATAGGRAMLAALLIGLCGLVFGVVRLIRRRRTTPAPPAIPSTRPTNGLMAAFARLELALTSTGRPRARAESVNELSWRLPDARSALETVEQHCYAPVPVSAVAAQRAAAAIDAVAASVLAGTDVAIVTRR